MAGLALVAGLAPRGIAEDVVFDIENMLPGEFTWHPERSPAGAVAVIVSIPEQRVHVYRNGVRIAVSTCSTGRPGHGTPTGVFTVLQKDRDHRSSTYGGAPMPNMNRLTWDGIALHAGNLPGYPASHGCVRLPLKFSELLFGITHLGTPVIIAGSKADPWELVHPGLVLGVPAEEEMAEAVAALEGKKHPSDWTAGAEYPIVTLLATGADRRAVLIEDGVEVAEGGLTVTGPGTLGEHVFVLNRGADGGLHWTGITHHPDPAAPLAAETTLLDRIRVSRELLGRFSRSLHPGATIIVSDLAATPDRRSGRDFVIMTADNLTAPRPRLPGDPRRPGDDATDRG